MSLFPNKHLSIALSPRAIAGIAHVGRWRPQAIDHQELRFEDNGLGNSLAGLQEAFARWAMPGAAVRIVVSNRYVRTAMLPWGGARLTAQESAILAQQQFHACYGDMDEWVVRTDRNCAYAESAVAFAMPASLLSEVDQLCCQHKLVCQGIVPAAAASWNRYGCIHAAESLLYGVLEAEQLWLLAAEKIARIWRPLSARMLSMPAEPLIFGSLQQTLERELLLQGLQPDTQIVLHGCDHVPNGSVGRIKVMPTNSKLSMAMEMAWMGGWA